jgi:hypothetical protein
MLSKPQKGYLVLADISGYTFFLANTELEHAHIAMTYLLEAIVAKMGSVLTILKLEGDAVFAFLEEEKLPDGKLLMDIVDQTYFAFREQAKSMHKGTTCPCKACQELPTLDLKFMVHHGDFVIQQVAGMKDILGSDVTLVHRLMKNSVAESTGWRGYALFTLKGLESLQVDQKAFIQQRESYEHLGDVETYVMDMRPRYEAMGPS